MSRLRYPSLVLVPAYLQQASFQLSRSRSSLSRILDMLVTAILVPAGASFQILVPARSSLILVPDPRSSSFPRSSPSFQPVPGFCGCLKLSLKLEITPPLITPPLFGLLGRAETRPGRVLLVLGIPPPLDLDPLKPTSAPPDH